MFRKLSLLALILFIGIGCTPRQSVPTPNPGPTPVEPGDDPEHQIPLPDSILYEQYKSVPIGLLPQELVKFIRSDLDYTKFLNKQYQFATPTIENGIITRIRWYAMGADGFRANAYFLFTSGRLYKKSIW